MVEDSKFSNTILTNIGHQMLTSISNGNKKITYTKAEAYAQDVSSISNETLKALTSLQGKELSANLLVSNDGGDVVTITANFRNKGLTKDVVFNSIGWFAKLDTDDAERGITANQEYLVGITPASGTQTLVAPPADQSSSQAISINLNMKLSDASNVNMTVSDAGAVHFNQLHDELVKYTTTADLTKLLAGKADLGLSYTKAEIDAKLLGLTTDTDGKVSADQVQALISDKANISDVYTKSQVDSALSTRDSQINTKANISDVYTKSQVDSALSTRDTEISTKANISDVYTKSDVDNALAVDRGRLGKLEGTQTLDSPDFNSITSTGVYYITNNTPANIKNNPVSQWGVLVVSNGNGNKTSQVYYPDDGSPQWCRLLNGSNWLPWYQLSTKKDISNAINKFDLSKVKFHKQYVNSDGQAADKTWSATKNDDGTYTIDLYNDDWTASKLHDVLAQLPNKANASDVYTKPEVDSKTSGNVVTAYDVASKNPTAVRDSYTNRSLVDQLALGQFADAINDINGTWNRYTHNDGFDLLTLWGQYGIHYCLNPNMTNVPDWFTDKRGTAFVFTFDNNSQTMIYASCTGYGLAYYNKLEGKWHKLATDNDIADLQNKLAQYTVDYNNNYVHDTTIDFNSYLHETRTIKVANVKANNGPLANTATIWGWLTTYHWDDNSVTQEYRDAGGEVFWRATSASASRPWTWHKLATDNDITDLQNNVYTKADIPLAFKGTLTSADDMNKVFESGMYITQGAAPQNFPPSDIINHGAWGTILVYNHDAGQIIQLWFIQGNVFHRWIANNGPQTEWQRYADQSDITDLQNQIQQLKDNQFEVQTFTDATAAANWESQRPGKRMAIVNK